jgi:hypothetical protein
LFLILIFLIKQVIKISVKIKDDRHLEMKEISKKRFDWPAKMLVILLERTNSRRRAVRCGAALWGESFGFKLEDDTRFCKKNKALETPSERSKDGCLCSSALERGHVNGSDATGNYYRAAAKLQDRRRRHPHSPTPNELSELLLLVQRLSSKRKRHSLFWCSTAACFYYRRVQLSLLCGSALRQHDGPEGSVEE